MRKTVILILAFLLVLSLHSIVTEAQACPGGTYEITVAIPISTGADDWYTEQTIYPLVGEPGVSCGSRTVTYTSTATIPVYTACGQIWPICTGTWDTGYLRLPVSMPSTAQLKSAKLSFYDTSAYCKDINIISGGSSINFRAGTFQWGCRQGCGGIDYNVYAILGYCPQYTYAVEGCTAAAPAGWYTFDVISPIQNLINQPGYTSGSKTTFEMRARTTEQGVGISAYESGNPAKLSLTYCTNCAGNVSLYLNPSYVSPSASVAPSATGMWGCGGKTVYFRKDSCSGQQVSSCAIVNGECTGSPFTAPSSTGSYTYYACIDKDEDNKFDSSGEASSMTLSVQTSPPCQGTYKVYPSDDAFVLSITPSTNYGSGNLQIANYYYPYVSPYTYVSKGYLKFNLEGLPAGSVVTNANLNLDAQGASGSVQLDISSTSDTWQEGTINWNNAPPATYVCLEWNPEGDCIRYNNPLASGTISTPGWRSYSVTSFVSGEQSGDKRASFVLTASYSPTSYIYVNFYSKEATGACVEWDLEGNCIRYAPLPQYYPYLEVSCNIPFDFNIGVNPSSGTVIKGGSTSTTVNTGLLTSGTQPVTLSAGNLPPGMTVSFSPNSCNPSCSSTMTVSTTSETSTGMYPIKVTGTSGSLTKSTTYKLTVDCPRGNPTVTIVPSSQSATAGASLTYSVNVRNNDDVECSPSTFSLTAVAPAGWSYSLENANILIGAQSTSTTSIAVVSDVNAAGGEYDFSVTATNNKDTNYKGTSSAVYKLKGCSGSVKLTINPTFASPSSYVVPSASGLSDCGGKTVYFRKDSCSGTQVSSCLVSDNGCTGSVFTLPATSGVYEYFACVDKNNDNDFVDSGESGSLIYNVGYSSLPEFDWTGIVQIMIISVIVLFIIKRKF